jgi:hypothetical protein
LHKQTGSDINLDRIFFPTIIRLVPWGRGQRWSSKCWFFSPLNHLTRLIAQENFIILNILYYSRVIVFFMKFNCKIKNKNIMIYYWRRTSTLIPGRQEVIML